MHTISTQPKNIAYFAELLSFFERLHFICERIGVTPVLYGSVAYLLHSKDNTIEVNDIDLLVPEAVFPKLIVELEKNTIFTHETTTYHSLKVFHGDLKISFDALEEYYKDIPYAFEDVTINAISHKVVSKEALQEVYKRGRDTIPFKRDAYTYKLERLIE